MFKDLPRYDQRKSAGQWVSEIPAHWEWAPARTLFQERRENSSDDEQLLSVTIGRGVIPQAELLSSTSKKDSSNTDKSKYKLVRTGDLVYNKMRAWQGAAGLSRYSGIVSPAYIVMTPRRDEAEYFHHLVRTPMFAKEAERWSYGITSDQWSLRPEHFKMIRFPVPPAEEQAAIVKYLAHANARIDKAITAKRRLIALLNEQVATEVEALVTGSEISKQHENQNPWIRSTPDKWSLMRIKHVLRGMEQGWSPQCDAQPAGDHEWGVLKVGCSNHGRFRASENKRLPEWLTPREDLEVQDGDLLVSRANTRDLVGSAAVALNPPPRLIFSDKTFRLQTRSSLADSQFLALAMAARSSRDQIESGSVGASHSMQNIGQGVIANLWIALPSLEEQREIVRLVSERSAPIEKTIARTEREIALLQEFRTRLVADVVTGQVDVREIAATLPEAPGAVLDLVADTDDALEEVLESVDA
ncbi:hypothetical protein ACFYXQ_30845 [Nocardia jiangxiensis]|uniref:Type I restriction enzyme, S subunit n=1 Tax=Nocardia jiangxiensis TaxID=282685 RepID=A0ABW6S7B7_9NOCA